MARKKTYRKKANAKKARRSGEVVYKVKKGYRVRRSK